MDNADPQYELKSFTAGDGYVWKYRFYPARGGVKGHVVAVHGIQSHAGWYGHTSAGLASAGYAVSFLDRRGSGVNERDRGHSPSFRRLLDDVAEYVRTLRPQGKPVFLLAISWGGKLGAAFQRRHGGLTDGLILISPGFCPKVKSPLLRRMQVAWSGYLWPRRSLPIPLNDPELFTTNPEWLDFLRHDPLSLHRASARFMMQSWRLDLYLGLTPRHVKLPVLVLLAGADQIIDNGKTRRFVARFAAADKTVIEYPGRQHTLEFEPDPDFLLRDVTAWLNERTAAGHKGS